MRSNNADVIIIGLGAMGSSAAYHLAQRGQRVLGLDTFTPPHDHGSSSGETMMIREAYFEHPLYVPFVQHAYDLWRQLEQRCGKQLLKQTGGLMIGPPDGMVVKGALASAREHNLQYEELSATEITRRFSVFQPSDDMVGVFEPRAGLLFPDDCIRAHLELAADEGATLLFDEPVARWESDGTCVRVHTATAKYEAAQLILSAGAWIPNLVHDLDLSLQVERMVLHWFEPKRNREAFSPDRLPIYMVEYEPNYLLYGFPLQPRGVKVALHHHGDETDPDDVAPVTPEERSHMHRLMSRYMPDAAGRILESATCMYTNTFDENFLIDFLPTHPNVLVASACSGHGFKFSSAIGEILADLLTEGKGRFNLEPFRIDRFADRRQPYEPTD